MFAVLVAFLFWLALNGRLALYGGFAVKQGRAVPGDSDPTNPVPAVPGVEDPTNPVQRFQRFMWGITQ